MQYNFTDGSGNRYKLQDSELTYSPMTAKNSSSGIYSGGEPFTKTLGKGELIKLIDVYERAFWSEEDQTGQRSMGSGTLIKILGEEYQRIYIKMRSPSLKTINAILKTFKG
ncbi:MAG: hypothetical protein P1U56_01825 [Saprospiraceae bacterium]|nr:hypothetical protein [Saprospiraceae bacterium]